MSSNPSDNILSFDRMTSGGKVKFDRRFMEQAGNCCLIPIRSCVGSFSSFFAAPRHEKPLWVT